jgi:peptidoglycan/LPS O-acetylase OafA/YrhL
LTSRRAVVLSLIISATVTTAAGAHDQQLVPYYAATAFMSLLVGLLAMARFARRKWRHKSFVINLIGAIVVAFTLIVNPGHKKPRGIASTRATEHDD